VVNEEMGRSTRGGSREEKERGGGRKWSRRRAEEGGRRRRKRREEAEGRGKEVRALAGGQGEKAYPGKRRL
jgi:hypothetical protein